MRPRLHKRQQQRQVLPTNMQHDQFSGSEIGGRGGRGRLIIIYKPQGQGGMQLLVVMQDRGITAASFMKIVSPVM